MIKRATNPRLHKRTFEYTMCFGFKWWILLLNAIVAKNREFFLFHNRTGYFLRNMLCFPKNRIGEHMKQHFGFMMEVLKNVLATFYFAIKLFKELYR